MLWRYLRIELKKALTGWFFWGIIGIGIVITLFSSKEIFSYFLDFTAMQSGEFAQAENNSISLFGTWIGGEYHTLGVAMYFFILPVLAIMAYGWSFFLEKKSGYIKNVITRVDKKVYYMSKYITTFAAGGLAVILPLLFNLLLTCLYSNFAIPDITYGYVSMFHGSLWSELFYTRPFFFCILYLIIDFVYGGLIACCCMALAFFLRNRLLVLLLPFLALLALDYLRWDIVYLLGQEVEISPMKFLHPTPYPSPVSGWILLGSMFLLLLATLGTCMLRGRKADVF